MPLKLVSPRPGRTPFYYVRGTFLGVTLERSTQVTDQATAKVILSRWRAQIARGKYSDQVPPEAVNAQPGTFLAAAVAYMQAGGDEMHLGPIIEMTGPNSLRDMALTDIDQMTVDRAAAELYPNVTAQTRNRQFYTPVSAVMKRAGIERRIHRPKGWRGKKSRSWLEKEQAFALLKAAERINPEFGLFCTLLCYTGMRLGEALAITVGAVDLGRQAVYLPQTKNGDARTVYLTDDLVTALANHPRGLNRPRDKKLIRFHAGGRLRDMLKEAMEEVGLQFPRRQGGFHLFRHTWATWMRRYGGLDTSGLVDTGAWRSRQSAAEYEHFEVSESARRADMLPTPNSGKGRVKARSA